MKKNFHIKILGQDLSVLSDSGDEHVTKVVSYVNEKIGEVGSKYNNKFSAINVAILAALNIADEYIRFKGEEEFIYGQLEKKSENLINLIDEINYK